MITNVKYLLMLSILIPVYNQTVVSLVTDLCDQCKESDLVFQILVFDDGSTPEIKESNRSLSHEFGVNYVELSENIGRAKIRNRLARMAQYENLLFLDGDSSIVKSDFVEVYLAEAKTQRVIYGGRVYQGSVPDEQKYILHWKYGRRREALPPDKRLLDPYLNFQSNNFLIKSWIFKEVLFDEGIEGYGYEDLLFSEKLKALGESIRHIDNPILHDGLEDAETFLHKSENAVRNLAVLNLEGHLQDVRLTKFYNKMKSYKALKTLRQVYQMRSAAIQQNLRSKNPKIRNFNFWKLMVYDRYMAAGNQSKVK